LAVAGRRYPIFNMIRDWTPLAFTLAAFQEMDWFTPARYTLEWERVWLQQDRRLLVRLGLARALEALGPVVPWYLELCYLLVYATGAFCVLTLWLTHRRVAVDRWMVVYLTGTLLAYALFPFFPSLPPLMHFDPAVVVTLFRRWNLWLLDAATIHSAVFPSAHMSSAFSAAWGLFAVLPRRRRFCVGDAVLRVERVPCDDLWTLPLRGGRGSGIRPQPRGRAAVAFTLRDRGRFSRQ
jgi:hypothetical protein